MFLPATVAPWPRISAVRAGAHQLGEIAAHLHVLDQQRGIAEMIVRIPDRHLVADRGAHMEDRLDLPAASTPNGMTLSLWLCTTDITSGRAS